MTRDDGPRRYTDEQARAIFERALRVEADGRMGHEELVAAAAEVGLSRQVVERAVAELELAQAEREATNAILGRRRRRLYNHLVPFLAINVFLFMVNWLTTPGAWWCLFPLFGWSLLLFFHAWLALSRRVSPGALRRELARSERRQRRTLQELAREAARTGRASPLSEVVEGGVAALFGRLAQQLGPGGRRATGVRVEPSTQSELREEGDSELARPVAGRKQGPS
jgi:hypothetical protein